MKIFNKLISILIVLLTISPVFAALTDADRQEFVHKNLLADLNPGFENSTGAWSKTGGTLAAVVSGTNLLIGKGSATWDSGSTGQILNATAITIPKGLYGRAGLFKCLIQVPSGAATHTIEVYDGTNIVASVPIVSSATPSYSSVSFIFPGSGTLRGRLVSVASDEPLIALDDCYLGAADNIQPVSQAVFYGSASFTPATSCEWSTSGTYVAFSADSDCVSPINKGNASGTAKIPQVVFASLPPGDYKVTASFTSFSAAQTCGWGISDGTTVEGKTQGSEANTYKPMVLSANFHYTTAGAKTFDIVGYKQGSNDCFVEEFLANTEYTEISVYKFPSVNETAATPDTYNWRVDANIAGDQPDLGTSVQSAFIGITAASLSLVNNPVATIAAKIPCSSTNPPTGLTCGVGDESVGVNFNLPAAGSVEACAEFVSYVNGASGDPDITFQIVETASNSQTILQTGNGRLNAYHPGGATGQTAYPTNVCGTFKFDSAGNKTLRLFYEQSAATAATNLILADSVHGRDIHWRVHPINQQVNLPMIFPYHYAVYHFDTNNGYGSGSTKIAKFTNTTSGYPIDPNGILTVINDATLGNTYTVNKRCKITLAFTFNTGGASHFGITKNSVDLTTILGNIAEEYRLVMAYMPSTDETKSVTVTDYAVPGDVYRPHADGVAVGGAQAGRSFIHVFAEEIP